MRGCVRAFARACLPANGRADGRAGGWAGWAVCMYQLPAGCGFLRICSRQSAAIRTQENLCVCRRARILFSVAGRRLWHVLENYNYGILASSAYLLLERLQENCIIGVVLLLCLLVYTCGASLHSVFCFTR